MVALEIVRAPRRKPGHLVLQADDGLRVGLTRAFRSVVEYAVAAAASVRTDRVRAVHEFRKSTRRARALLVLCRGFLLEEDYQRLRMALRDAARPTSHLRDGDVFPAVLGAVAVPDGLASAVEKARIALAKEPAAAPAEVATILHRGVMLVDELPGQFEASLPAELDWPLVEEGLRQSYRRVRASLKRAVKSKKPGHFHHWRKRTKELNYQIELLCGGLDGEMGEMRRTLSNFATELGDVTDRVNLAKRLGRRSGGKRAKRLTKAVRKEGKRMLREALADGEILFSVKPKAFAEIVVAQVRDATAS